MESRSARARWTLLALYGVAQCVVGFFVWMILFYDNSGAVEWTVLSEPVKTISSLGTILPRAIFGAIAALLGLQMIFLWPVRKPSVGARGAPLWLSLAVAGLAAAALVTAVALAIVDLIWVAGPEADPSLLGAVPWAPWVIGALVLTSWAVATPLLVAFCRRGRTESRLSRIAATLFLGTLVEAAAIIPIDVLVRRRQPCYCEQGTFWALTICMSIGVFALGPAILLPLLSRRRKRWYAGHCDACGYDMSGTPRADRCPECGAGWRPCATS